MSFTGIVDDDDEEEDADDVMDDDDLITNLRTVKFLMGIHSSLKGPLPKSRSFDDNDYHLHDSDNWRHLFTVNKDMISDIEVFGCSRVEECQALMLKVDILLPLPPPTTTRKTENSAEPKPKPDNLASSSCAVQELPSQKEQHYPSHSCSHIKNPPSFGDFAPKPSGLDKQQFQFEFYGVSNNIRLVRSLLEEISRNEVMLEDEDKRFTVAFNSWSTHYILKPLGNTKPSDQVIMDPFSKNTFWTKLGNTLSHHPQIRASDVDKIVHLFYFEDHNHGEELFDPSSRGHVCGNYEANKNDNPYRRTKKRGRYIEDPFDDHRILRKIYRVEPTGPGSRLHGFKRIRKKVEIFYLRESNGLQHLEEGEGDNINN